MIPSRQRARASRDARHIEKTTADIWLRRLFGFLLGSTLAGASVYYYILEEYKVSNELLTEDIYVRPTFLFS